VNFSRFGVSNIWASFFVLAATYFFVRGLRRRGWWNFLAAGIFVGLTPYAGFYGVFLPVLLGLFWLHGAIFARALDGRTHVLALGLGLAIVRIRGPGYFLLVAWMLVFIQNGIWSVDFEAPQAFRTSAVTPAVAMLSALPLARLWEIAASASASQHRVSNRWMPL